MLQSADSCVADQTKTPKFVKVVRERANYVQYSGKTGMRPGAKGRERERCSEIRGRSWKMEQMR